MSMKKRMEEKCANLCTNMDSVLGQAAALAPEGIFAKHLAEAVVKEIGSGEVFVEVTPGEQEMADWLASIRSSQVWTGTVPYAEKDSLSFRAYLIDHHMEDLGNAEYGACEDVLRHLRELLENDGAHAAADFVKENSDRFQDEMWFHIISATLSINKKSFRCNLVLGHLGEGNSDFGAMREMIDLLEDGVPDDYSMLNNSLTWLVHQQGYSMADVVERMKDISDEGQSKFIDSVREEILDCVNVMNAVTICFSINAEDLENLVAEDGKNLKISKDAAVGIFSPWVGGGSLMGIALEKDIILPQSMISQVQIEGAKNREYSVNNVFGMSDAFWKEDCLTFVDEPAYVLTPGKLDADIRKILALSGESEDSINISMGPK